MPRDKSKYIIHGQVIQCDFNLSPCPESKKNISAKIKIAATKTIPKQIQTLFHTLRFPNSKVYARFYQLKSGYRVHFPQQGDFFISHSGKTMTYQFDKSLNSFEKTGLLTNHALPLALSLQGNLVIHAASVIIRKKLTLICAPAGLGKSTLAAFFEQQNLRVLSDDTCVLVKKGNAFYSSLSVPILRTWKKSKTEKVWQFLNPTHPLKLYRVDSLHFPYIDDNAKPSKKLQARRLTPLETTKALLPEVFRLNWSAIKLTRELKLISNLSNCVPAYDWPHQHRQTALRSVTKMLLEGPQ